LESVSQNRDKKHLVYIAPSLSSFIRSDIEALEKKYRLRVLTGRWDKKHLTLWLMFKQALILLFARKRLDVMLISFAGYWSVFPVLLGKLRNIPVFIILNGTDCASIPSINYGSLRKPVLKMAIRISMRFATKLLPVSASLRRVENTFYAAEDKEKWQGYLSFFPGLNTESQVIPNGFDLSYWSKDPEIEKETNSFIAVFSCQQFFLKGGDLILKIAEQRPNWKFYVAGCEKAPPQTELPSNVELLGRLGKAALKEYYSRAKYVLQLSIFEGFGCALCEAMLCECIPIVSGVNALPEIVMDARHVVESRTVQNVMEVMDKLQVKYPGLQKGDKFRKSIVSRFSMENRIELLEENFREFNS
jgi:glycosyltransferase involved in cell wall biosynthesis